MCSDIGEKAFFLCLAPSGMFFVKSWNQVGPDGEGAFVDPPTGFLDGAIEIFNSAACSSTVLSGIAAMSSCCSLRLNKNCGGVLWG